MAGRADYYALLGVERNADFEAIKRAFRGLARKLHPDVSDAPGAEERFREVAEAYRVLSAPRARFVYDRLGHPVLGEGSSDSGSRVVVEVVLTPLEARQGVWRTILVPRLETCGACSGEDAREGRAAPCAACGGSGWVKHASQLRSARILQFEGCSDCAGTGWVEPTLCRECGGAGQVTREREIDVVVPAGARDGKLVALGDGEAARVRVRLVLDEPRLVRYGAAAALAVAVAFVVFLLFFS
jgi:molecular chaperone DnaJ